MSFLRQLDLLNEKVVACERCPRLRGWCEQVAREKRRAYADQEYWGKPVPSFGDPYAERLIVGLAPAAHGANRTGRLFTGDRSGEWLFRALHRAGFANQPSSNLASDGLKLHGVLITGVCRCAPPGNKPTPDEMNNCRVHLSATMALSRWRAILCLGGIAWQRVVRELGVKSSPKFAHGSLFQAPGLPALVACYHPSQQNTFTGRLTEKMLDEAILRFREA